MPHRGGELRIRDIVESIQSIFSYTSGMEFNSFSDDRKTVDAVIRNFTVIGEAAAHIPKDLTERFPSIPWQDMRDMRNIVVHEYFGISDRILWDTIREDLPDLLSSLIQLLEDN